MAPKHISFKNLLLYYITHEQNIMAPSSF